MKVKVLPYLILFFISCKAQILNLKTIEKDDRSFFISLNNYPSWDTLEVVFYKKDIWFKKVIFKNHYQKPPLITKCLTCDSIFSSTFFLNLKEIESETISNDCTLYEDSTIAEKRIRKIKNFYNITDLQEESISYKYEKKEKIIKFLEPRLAVKYCSNNKERLLFIKTSDILRNIN